MHGVSPARRLTDSSSSSSSSSLSTRRPREWPSDDELAQLAELAAPQPRSRLPAVGPRHMVTSPNTTQSTATQYGHFTKHNTIQYGHFTKYNATPYTKHTTTQYGHFTKHNTTQYGHFTIPVTTQYGQGTRSQRDAGGVQRFEARVATCVEGCAP